jgi:hypothetical protein
MASAVLLKLLETREGRENRPQLRCGYASQTPTGRTGRAGKANRRASAGEGEERGCASAARRFQNSKYPNAKIQRRPSGPRSILGFVYRRFEICARGRAQMRSPNIWFRRLTRSAAEFFARGVREIFIAK